MPLENGLNLTTMPLSPNGMASGLHPEIIGIRLPVGVLNGTNKRVTSCHGDNKFRIFAIRFNSVLLFCILSVFLWCMRLLGVAVPLSRGRSLGSMP